MNEIRGLKNRYINAALVLASFVSAVVLLEVLLLRVGFIYLPLKVHHHFGDIGILAQPTKRSVVPKNYTLVLGDSYAQGAGDWLYAANHARNSAFNSVHVLYDMTGEDTINFGKGGIGSSPAMIEVPTAAYRIINSSPLIEMAAPKKILVYFYEGNDLNNNVDDYAVSGARDVRDVVNWSIARSEVTVKRKTRLGRNLRFAFDGLLKIARFNIKLAVGKTRPTLYNFGPGMEWAARKKGANLVRVNSTDIFAPPLQGPSPLLPPEKIDLGVQVFAESLAYIKGYFGSSRIYVIYIPSVFTSYVHVRKRAVARIHTLGRPLRTIPVIEAEARSNYICSAIKAATLRNGARFVDVRPTILAATRTQVLHGAVDPDHFNKLGYETLARAVVQGMLQPMQPGQCSKIKITPTFH